MGDAVGAISGVAETPVTADLSEVVDQTSLNADTNIALSRVMSDALEQAVSTPGQFGKDIGTVDSLTDTTQGDFAEQRNSLLSSTNEDTAEATPDDMAQEIEEAGQALAGLMVDLANWHVTWGVARNAQKDLTHVLKSN